MTRDDLNVFRSLNIDFNTIGLMEDSDPTRYFCDPVDWEPVGRIGCDGVHFILLPGDEAVYCVDPSMGEEGKYVLPVGGNFREFLSFVLYCKDANPLSQIWRLTEEGFRNLLAEDAAASWTGSEEYFAKKDAALAAIAETFDLAPVEPYHNVKALQAAFAPGILQFSDEYYDTLGMERK